jgi:hypothetical protein
MQGSRLELANHNGKGAVPRGRARNPEERIEVDLQFSFLRSQDPYGRVRMRVQKRFVGKYLESFRELSVIVDGSMATKTREVSAGGGGNRGRRPKQLVIIC